MSLLSIVIPAYNEAKTIHLILDKIQEVELIGGFQKEIIIVDDCSKDGTYETLMAYHANNPHMQLNVAGMNAIWEKALRCIPELSWLKGK
jgi:glycosyltransferase involved in cell wall biosynthesis